MNIKFLQHVTLDNVHVLHMTKIITLIERFMHVLRLTSTHRLLSTTEEDVKDDDMATFSIDGMSSGVRKQQQ